MSKCNLCNSKDFEKTNLNKDLVICKNCGLIFFPNRPDQKRIVTLYNSGHFSPTEYYKKMELSDKKNFTFVFNKIKNTKSCGKLLDIGCSTGNFMSMARNNDWDVYGIEVNKDSVNECKRKKLNVKKSTFESSNYNDKYFDWIHMGDVIEHVTDPKGFLKLANKKMKKNSILTLSTPDISRWIARKTQVKPGEHLYYFNKSTIKNILEKTGFRVLMIKNYSPYRNFSAMSHSSTFSRTSIKFFFKVIGMFGNAIFKLPIKDEIIVVAEKI
ncbi:class I SAM-dependent methyltransferase [Candidatus Aenigmatarchaeota archaeon]